MSRLKKEISETKTETETETETEIKDSEVKQIQPQSLTEDLLDQIAGGWVNAYARWGTVF